MTIKHLVYRLAHEFNGGAIALAALMDRNPKVLQNKLNPNSQTHFLTIDELETIGDFTNGNLDIAQFFAEKANAVVVKLPQIPEGDMALLDLYMQIMKELGDVSSAFQKAYADGDIDHIEFNQIASEVDDVVARLLEWQAAVKRVVR